MEIMEMKRYAVEYSVGGEVRRHELKMPEWAMETADVMTWARRMVAALYSGELITIKNSE